VQISRVIQNKMEKNRKKKSFCLICSFSTRASFLGSFFFNLKFVMTEQVYDEDKLKQDKKLGVVALPLKSLQHDSLTELSLNLLSSLDTLKVKDKKDRGTLIIKVSFFCFLNLLLM
jgi:hypothetical protein